MWKQLTLAERYYISQRIASSTCINDIAKELGIHRSTIYRELNRNKDLGNGAYNHLSANHASVTRKSEASSKKKFSKFRLEVEYCLISKLELGWSPEQISGRMKLELKTSISAKSIYSYVWHNKNNGGKLYKNLPHSGKAYKSGNSSRCKIPNRVDISKRPYIVNKKWRIGDFEGDTVIGTRNGSKQCLLTLVDRKSKYSIIRKINNKSAKAVQDAMEEIYSSTIIPFKTITVDNGTEFSNHQEISINIGCDIFFARPYKSCDRGLSEHNNGLIRRFLPKKTDFAHVSNDKIIHVQDLLNDRPRKSLGYLTPNEVMTQCLEQHYPRFKHNVAFHR